MIKQLKDISRLMESDIFYLDIQDGLLQYEYSNKKMFTALNKAIYVLEAKND